MKGTVIAPLLQNLDKIIHKHWKVRLHKIVQTNDRNRLRSLCNCQSNEKNVYHDRGINLTIVHQTDHKFRSIGTHQIKDQI